MLEVDLPSTVTRGQRHSGDLEVVVQTMKPEICNGEHKVVGSLCNAVEVPWRILWMKGLSFKGGFIRE
ncbi:hypothetical protein L484_007237 [Morus notabilis]|uniref:Uncharacterized protein n=1 Tax=Morus notabilis TaxID=981085 RepID=W9R4A3_9ROSA|nr:hypothetical protein L484_007237 [Morus notabilis]